MTLCPGAILSILEYLYNTPAVNTTDKLLIDIIQLHCTEKPYLQTFFLGFHNDINFVVNCRETKAFALFLFLVPVKKKDSNINWVLVVWPGSNIVYQ